MAFARKRLKDLSYDVPPPDGPTTPFQEACASKYIGLPKELKPSPHDFLRADPVIQARKWQIDGPSDLMADIRTDSALDILRKAQIRANGGTIIIDSHAATVTDQFVRSEFDHLGTPDVAGAQFVVRVPNRTLAQDRITVLEADQDVGRSTCGTITEGHKVFCFGLTRLALGQRTVLGEKTAQVFDHADSIPHLQTAIGGRMNAFSNLALRCSDPLSVLPIVARELDALARITIPRDYLKLVHEFVGDPYVRSAALGDRKYHALTAHPCNAGCVSIRTAPMTSKSYGHDVPVPWQMLRTCVRSIGHLNVSLDRIARRIATEHPDRFSIGYDVAGGSLAPFAISDASVKVMYMTQLSRSPTRNHDSILGSMDQRRVVESALFTEGGIRDQLAFVALKAEMEADKQDAEDEFEDIPSVAKLRLHLAKTSVFGKSAILKPVIQSSARSAKDDMEIRSSRPDTSVRGISKEEIRVGGANLADSLGALIRHAVSIAYMANYSDVRLNCAMLVKQWQMLAKGKSRTSAKISVGNMEVIQKLCANVFTSRVLDLMESFVVYCHIGSTSNMVSLMIRKGAPAPKPRVGSWRDTFLTYVQSPRGNDERFVLRRVCGKIISAGMSDSGLMFSMSTGLASRRTLSSIIVEHMRYKIDVWRKNYAAQLELSDPDAHTGDDAYYRQMVLWQQKLAVLKAIELRSDVDGVQVLARERSVAKILVTSYEKRHLTITRRIAAPEAGKKDTRVGKWKKDAHPWGELEDAEFRGHLVASGIDATVMHLAKKDPDYWVIPPYELYLDLKKLLDEIVDGVRGALEYSDVTALKELEEESDSYALALPLDIDAELDAKFVFSLNDAPRDRVRNIEASAPPASNAVVSIRDTRRNAATTAGVKAIFKRSFPSRRRNVKMSLAPTVKETVIINDILTHVPVQLHSSILMWLGTACGHNLIGSMNSDVLPRQYRATEDTVHDVAQMLIQDHGRYLAACSNVSHLDVPDDMVT